MPAWHRDSDNRDPFKTFGSGGARPEREQLGIENDARSRGVTADPRGNIQRITMHTIVLATQKVGSGKSTLAIGLARAAIHAGHNVRLIETDTQGTLSNWQDRRPYAEPPVEPVYIAADVEQRLQQIAGEGVTITIIDTARGVSAATTAAIRHADLCLIPARPSVADIEAATSTLSTVRAWNKPFAFVLNQTAIRGQRIANAATALGDEAERELGEVLAQPFIAM